MDKNHKGKVMIHSLDELPQDLRKKLFLASFGIGLLVFLIVVLAFLVSGIFSSKESSLGIADWALFVATPLGAFGFGACFGFELMLSDLGFALALRHHTGSDFSSINQPFSSHDSPNYHRSNDYSSHVNINPSSGRPMSGSSGMDISGNPYGTRSW